MEKREASAVEAARTYLDQLGWSRRALATRVDVPEQTIRRMLSGTVPMDPGLFDWLKRAAGFISANPPPRPKITVD
jgi:ribosome-binding protein aMBF1 (putative translation factor)